MPVGFVQAWSRVPVKCSLVGAKMCVGSCGRRSRAPVYGFPATSASRVLTTAFTSPTGRREP